MEAMISIIVVYTRSDRVPVNYNKGGLAKYNNEYALGVVFHGTGPDRACQEILGRELSDKRSILAS